MVAALQVNGGDKQIKSKNQLRRLKQKQRKQTATSTPIQTKEEGGSDANENVEYVFEQLDLNGSTAQVYSDVFARFQAPPESASVCVVVSEKGG